MPRPVNRTRPASPLGESLPFNFEVKGALASRSAMQVAASLARTRLTMSLRLPSNSRTRHMSGYFESGSGVWERDASGCVLGTDTAEHVAEAAIQQPHPPHVWIF